MSDDELNAIDEKGTGQDEGVSMLEKFCAAGFNGDIDNAAVALGRTPDHLRDVISGEMPVDDDLASKIRGIARERGFEIE